MTTHVGGRIFAPSAMYTSSLLFVNVQYALLSILYGFCFQHTCSIALPIWRESLHLCKIRFKFAFFMSHLKGVKGHQSLEIMKNCEFYQRGAWGGYFKERALLKRCTGERTRCQFPKPEGAKSTTGIRCLHCTHLNTSEIGIENISRCESKVQSFAHF